MGDKTARASPRARRERRLTALPTRRRQGDVGLAAQGSRIADTAGSPQYDGQKAAVARLASLGVAVKVISGDSRLVVEHIADLIGLGRERVLTGRQLDGLHDEALWRTAERTDLFVEVDPTRRNASSSR